MRIADYNGSMFEHFGERTLHTCHVRLGLGFLRLFCDRRVNQRLLRVEEHTGTQTHATVVALQYVVVAAAFATLPEFVIVGKFGECDRFLT